MNAGNYGASPMGQFNAGGYGPQGNNGFGGPGGFGQTGGGGVNGAYAPQLNQLLQSGLFNRQGGNNMGGYDQGDNDY